MPNNPDHYTQGTRVKLNDTAQAQGLRPQRGTGVVVSPYPLNQCVFVRWPTKRAPDCFHVDLLSIVRPPPKKPTKTNDALISEYLEAFRTANKDRAPPDISFWGGWFYLESPRSPRRALRRKAIEKMRDTLRSVARSNSEVS